MKILENEDFLLDMQITDQVDLNFMTGEHLDFLSDTFFSIMHVKIKLFDILAFILTRHTFLSFRYDEYSPCNRWSSIYLF